MNYWNILVKYSLILQEARWLIRLASKVQISMGSRNPALRNHTVQFYLLVRLSTCNHCAHHEQLIQLKVASWAVEGADKYTLMERLPKKWLLTMLKKINQDEQIELIRKLLFMQLRHHASTTISVTAGRWLDTVLCLTQQVIQWKARTG